MVDFTLTDEQKALREMAHDFAAKEIRPVAWEYDKDGTWPEEVLRKAWELGLMNTHVPEEYGGPGASYLEGCLIEEELAWGCSGIATSLGANGLASAPLGARRLRGAQEAATSGCSPRTSSSRSFCLTEPDAGSDVSGMRTTAVRTRRQVRHQRLEVLHHQRRLRRLVHGLRQDRQGGRPPRHLLLPRPPRRHRHGGQEGGQDGPAGLQHRDHHLQRDRDPGRPPDRRGEQGLQARDDDARPHAPRRGGDGHRHRPRGVRVRDQLLARSASSSACRSRCTRRSSS